MSMDIHKETFIFLVNILQGLHRRSNPKFVCEHRLMYTELLKTH